MTDLETAVKDSLDRMVSGVDQDAGDLAHAVSSRVAAGRRRRRRTFLVCGAAVTVGVLVSAPLLVTHPLRSGGISMEDPMAHLRDASPQAYGQHLISLVDLPPGAHQVDAAPTRGLEHPQESVSLDPKPIQVMKWWTFDTPALSLWQWVTHHHSPGLTWNGTMGGFPIMDGIRPPVASIQLAPSAGLRDGFAYGALDVVVASLGPDRSAIAVIATVEPIPMLPLAEHVPTQGVTAVVAWHPRADGPLQHLSLSPASSSRLAGAFDELPASTLGAHSCPSMTGANDLTVTFRAEGHVWRADYSGCFDIRVSRDGVDLRALTVSWTGEGHRPAGQGDFFQELKADGVRVP